MSFKVVKYVQIQMGKTREKAWEREEVASFDDRKSAEDHVRKQTAKWSVRRDANGHKIKIRYEVEEPYSSGAIWGGKRFLPHSFAGPKGESKLEQAVIENYRHVLGKGTLYLPIKKLIGSHLKKVTDGLLLDFNERQHPSFWIVEVELSTHHLEHIQTQMIGFLRALEDERTLRGLVKTVRAFIDKSEDANDEWIQLFYAPFWSDVGETDYEFLDNLLHEKCGLLIIIDQVTPDLKEIVRFLWKSGKVKVVEFETFSRDGEFVHKFSQPDLTQSD